VVLLAPSLLFGTLGSHSSPHNLVWASQFSEQFRAGILYPRWMPESFDGLGAPTFYFYPPLAFWIDSLLAIATFDVLSVSYRLSLTSWLLLWGSGLAMYAWLRSEQSERRLALIGALAYMAAPYHLFDHYVRGAIAEFAAYAVLPLVVLGIAMVADRRRTGVVLLAAAYAVLLLSHLPTALLISVTALPCYALFRAWRLAGRRAAVAFLARCAVAGTLGLGLAAFYVVPAMALLKTISVENLWSVGFSVETWFLFTPHRWIPPYQMMLMIVAISAAWCLAVAGVVAGSRGVGSDNSRRPTALFWASLCLASLVLMSGLVPWFWSAMPLVSKVQFPWRLLIVVEFSAITALCLLPWADYRRARSLAYRAVIVVVALTVGLIGSSIAQRVDYTLKGNGTPPQDAKEYLPAGFPQRDGADYYDLGLEPVKAVPAIACVPAPRLCRLSEERFGNLRVEVESDAPVEVTLRRFFFPAWRLDNGLPLAPTEPLQLVSFKAPAGRTSVALSRVVLPVEHWAWAISGLSLALILALFVQPIWATAARRGIRQP
jgi:6-pyruvoyl-tetrahydropterin synthase related domain